MAIFNIIKLRKQNDAYHCGDQKIVAAQHNVSEATVRRIELDVMCFEIEGVVLYSTSQRKGRCGRKTQYTTPEIEKVVTQLTG